MIYKKFLETIEKYQLIQQGDFILVGLSGGADSVALLYLLCKVKQQYNINLIAVHVHHGLRGKDADEDMMFCERICKELNIELRTHHANIQKEAKKRKQTIEETGRDVRYEIFFSIMNEVQATKIAVAHNQNDQAETMLMRFFRGTGIKGLSGIKVKRDCIIRPLLFVDRENIEMYCRKEKIEYRIDKTNYELDYMRNYIRHDIIAKLKENCNENIVKTLSRTATIISEEEQFLHNLTQEELHKVTKIKNDRTYIYIKDFKKYDIALQKRILRQICLKYNKESISSNHIDSILQLLYKSSGKMLYLPQELRVLVEFDWLCIYKSDNKCLKYCYDLILDKEIFIKEHLIYVLMTRKPIENECTCKGVFNYDIIQNGIQLRNRRGGDKIFLAGISGNKKLKDWFIEKKFSYSDRESQMLLADGQNILWITGKLFSDSYKSNSNTKNKLYVYIRKANAEMERN